MPDIDQRKVALLLGSLHDFLRTARVEPTEVLVEAAEQIEIDLMVRHPHGPEKHLLQMAIDYLNRIIADRGAKSDSNIFGTLGQALADED